MNNKYLLIFILFFAGSTLLLAQEQKDSVDLDDWDAWGEEDNHPDFNFDFDGFGGKGKPTISLNYGLAELNHNNLSASFSDPNLIEAKFGYTHEDTLWSTSNILKARTNYLTIGNISNDIGGKSTSGKIKTNSWRVELGWMKGYGYNLGMSAIIPYYYSSLSWTRIEVKDSLTNISDREILDRFNKSFRFGTTAEGGVRIKLIPNLAVEAGYERAVVFERHLFWKWLGSALIEQGGQWAVDAFVNEIGDSSPFAVPIVNFVLKNAVSYGMYELRKDKMNWPFESAAPLMYDQFKVGVTFIF